MIVDIKAWAWHVVKRALVVLGALALCGAFVWWYLS